GPGAATAAVRGRRHRRGRGLPAARVDGLPLGPGEVLQRVLCELPGPHRRNAGIEGEPAFALRSDGPGHPADAAPAWHSHGGQNVNPPQTLQLSKVVPAVDFLGNPVPELVTELATC